MFCSCAVRVCACAKVFCACAPASRKRANRPIQAFPSLWKTQCLSLRRFPGQKGSPVCSFRPRLGTSSSSSRRRQVAALPLNLSPPSLKSPPSLCNWVLASGSRVFIGAGSSRAFRTAPGLGQGWLWEMGVLSDVGAGVGGATRSRRSHCQPRRLRMSSSTAPRMTRPSTTFCV